MTRHPGYTTGTQETFFILTSNMDDNRVVYSFVPGWPTAIKTMFRNLQSFATFAWLAWTKSFFILSITTQSANQELEAKAWLLVAFPAVDRAKQV